MLCLCPILNTFPLPPSLPPTAHCHHAAMHYWLYCIHLNGRYDRNTCHTCEVSFEFILSFLCSLSSTHHRDCSVDKPNLFHLNLQGVQLFHHGWVDSHNEWYRRAAEINETARKNRNERVLDREQRKERINSKDTSQVWHVFLSYLPFKWIQ